MANRNATPKMDSRSTALRDKVYTIAAEVFHRKGYDNTSMNDIAEAVGLTKAGLYHHVTSKEHLLSTILEEGMDMTEARVIAPLRGIPDPLVRLRKLIELHLKLLLEGRQLAVTGLLHECQSLAEEDRRRINRRKKQYVRAVTDIVRDVLDSRGMRALDPKLAALALLGMLNWTYQWYKPSGSVKPEEVVEQFQNLFMNGLLGSLMGSASEGVSAQQSYDLPGLEGG
jgi:TetR/AcrR family transcriptional regulator, cholesterol catabolism regulator